MTSIEQAQLERLGFTKIHTGPGLSGERLWWKRIDGELTIVRQRDGKTKRDDLSNSPTCPSDTPTDNRQWAIALASDDLRDWQH